ncbi:MAG TPA: hypothetical protein VF352_01070, partial [Anaerolineales bacterium]
KLPIRLFPSAYHRQRLESVHHRNKSEDSIFVSAHSDEKITNKNGWPTISTSIDSQTFDRSAILEVIG